MKIAYYLALIWSTEQDFGVFFLHL